MSRNNPHSSARGFTLIEMLVIAPIVILVIGAFITVIVNMTGDVLAARSSTLLTYNIQSALNQIQNDVKLSSGFLAQTNISEGISNANQTLTAPQGTNNGTGPFYNIDSTGDNVLILNTIATTANPISTTSGFVYLNNMPNSCSGTQYNQNTPLTFNVVYFISNNSLWRRVIMPSDYATAGCSAPWQRPSCNPTYMAAYGPFSSCVTQDEDLLDNISSSGFNLEYFPSASSTLASSGAVTPTDTSLATINSRNTALQSLTTVSASISVSSTVAGRSITQSGTILATRLGPSASSNYNLGNGATVSIPAAPSGLTVTYNSPGNVTASWYPDGGTGVAAYTLQYSNNPSFSNTSPGVSGTSNASGTSITLSGLTGSSLYYFRVEATNNAGTSSYSSAVSQSTINSTSGLVGWWPFDGNANDSSPSGNNTGTITSATSYPYTLDSQSDTAYSFNGTSSQITFANSTALSPTSAITVSAWVDPTALSGSTVGIVSKDISTGDSNPPYVLQVSTAGFNWEIDNSSDSTVNVVCTDSALLPTTNAWYFLTGTFNGSSMKMYVNGTLCTNTGTQTGIGATTGLLRVGQQKTTFNRWFTGYIDDVRVYNRSLTPTEVSILYNAFYNYGIE